MPKFDVPVVADTNGVHNTTGTARLQNVTVLPFSLLERTLHFLITL
jgi:hypothetical protein